MNAMHARLLSFPIVVLGSLWMGGCFVTKCPDSTPIDGGVQTTTKDNCVQFEMGTTYQGTPVGLSGAVVSGGTVRVGDRNGDILVDRTNPAGTAVGIEAIPFDIEPANADGERRAIEVMNSMSRPSVSQDSSGSLTVESTESGMHGWHLRVHLPSDFAGALVARNSNGQITTSGVPGPIEASTDNGSITATGVYGVVMLRSGNGSIRIAGLPRGSGGSAYTENGSVTLDLRGTVPNLTISAVATDPILVESPAGATWTSYGDAPNSQRIDIGDTTQGAIDLRTDLGDITISG